MIHRLADPVWSRLTILAQSGMVSHSLFTAFCFFSQGSLWWGQMLDPSHSSSHCSFPSSLQGVRSIPLSVNVLRLSSMASHGSPGRDVGPICVDLVPIWVVCIPLTALAAGSAEVMQSPHLPINPASKTGAKVAVCRAGTAVFGVDVTGPSLSVCPLVATILSLSKSSFTSYLQVTISTVQVVPQGQHRLRWHLCCSLQLLLTVSGSQVSLQVTAFPGLTSNILDEPLEMPVFLWHFKVSESSGCWGAFSGAGMALLCRGVLWLAPALHGCALLSVCPSRSFLRCLSENRSHSPCPTGIPTTRAFYSGGSVSLRVSHSTCPSLLFRQSVLSLSDLLQLQPHALAAVGPLCHLRVISNASDTGFRLPGIGFTSRSFSWGNKLYVDLHGAEVIYFYTVLYIQVHT